MTVEINDGIPLENEGNPVHLKGNGQEGNSFVTENLQLSDKVEIKPSPVMNNDIISKEIIKTEQLNCSTVELKLCETPSDKGILQVSQEVQPTTIIVADIHNPHEQLRNQAIATHTTDKSCIDPSNSNCSALELKNNTNERTNNISELVNPNSTKSTNQDETNIKNSDESIVDKTIEENSKNVNATDCQCVSNNFVIQEKENSSPKLIQNDSAHITVVSRNPISDLPRKSLDSTYETSEDCSITETDTEVYSEDKIHYVAEPDIMLMKEVFSSYGNVLPQYFHTIVEGLFVHGDSGCPVDVKPSWFDPDKFHLGQEVAMKHFFGLQFAQLLNLLLVLNMPDGLTPLIFSGQSDTPFKAFKRYLSTALRVRSWYLDDLWDPKTEGHKNIRVVRKMHDSIRNKLNSTDPQELIKKGTLCSGSDTACPAVWSPLHDKLQDDFESTCPYPQVTHSSLIQLHRNHNFVNQTDMAITQFGFVGLFILYPAYFGAHKITDEELDGYLFLWRCIGYLLGMEDKYNFCNGSLEVVKQRSLDLVEYLGKPSLRSISRDWEHMTRCVTEGISFYVEAVSFEVSLLYLCSMLGLYTPRLRASLTFRQKITYYFTWLTFWVFIRIPGAQGFFNRAVRMNLKRAQTASTMWLRQKEEKKYPFQDNNICS